MCVTTVNLAAWWDDSFDQSHRRAACAHVQLASMMEQSLSLGEIKLLLVLLITARPEERDGVLCRKIPLHFLRRPTRRWSRLRAA